MSDSNHGTNQNKEIYFDPNFLKIDLEKLRIFITVLEEHEQNCERDEKFPEAAITRDKIKLLRDVEEITILNDLENLQQQQVCYVFLLSLVKKSSIRI